MGDNCMGGAYNQRSGKFECGPARKLYKGGLSNPRQPELAFPFLICFDASKVVLLSVVTLMETN